MEGHEAGHDTMMEADSNPVVGTFSSLFCHHFRYDFNNVVVDYFFFESSNALMAPTIKFFS